jgi:hypothetical protein
MAQAPVFELPFNSEIAFEKVLAACAEVGKVEESSALTKFIIVKAKYGLNTVKARISVSSSGAETSTVEMLARGQDVWGIASRTVMDRIIAAIR